MNDEWKAIHDHLLTKADPRPRGWAREALRARRDTSVIAYMAARYGEWLIRTTYERNRARAIADRLERHQIAGLRHMNAA